MIVRNTLIINDECFNRIFSNQLLRRRLFYIKTSKDRQTPQGKLAPAAPATRKGSRKCAPPGGSARSAPQLLPQIYKLARFRPQRTFRTDLVYYHGLPGTGKTTSISRISRISYKCRWALTVFYPTKVLCF